MPNQKTIYDLLNRYRGLREKDLCSINPEYSCVVCRRYYSGDCDDGRLNGACMEHSIISEDDFAIKYNFK